MNLGWHMWQLDPVIILVSLMHC